MNYPTSSHESKRFTFYLDGSVYTAYVRYYDDGYCDVEIDGDGDFSPKAYEFARDIADNECVMSILFLATKTTRKERTWYD